MKGAGKLLIGIGVAAALFLLYVHVQISMFRVSYSIDAKFKELTKQHEYYNRLKFQIDQMKAPQSLAEKMKESELNLELPKEIHLLEVSESPVILKATAVDKVAFQPLSKGLMDFLGRWVKVAQADTDNR